MPSMPVVLVISHQEIDNYVFVFVINFLNLVISFDYTHPALTRLLAWNNSSDLTMPSAVLPNTAAVIMSADNLWNCSKGTEATVPLILLAMGRRR